MRTYNITKNLNTNAGRNKYSIPIGTTRNIRGSANRIFQYCKQNSDDPFYCMFGISKPSPPIKTCLNGFVSYSYTYTGSGSINEAVVLQNLPVYSIADVLNVNPQITIVGNNVYVEIITCLNYLPSYPDDVGISLNSNPDLVNFINTNTNGITFTASSNCPFAKNGSQFKGVNNLTIAQAKGFREITFFTPYFLPGTSLSGCFQNCSNFNSNISGWDTTNVVNMSSMFNNATAFNINISSWNTSNVTNMTSMFEKSNTFNQNVSSWDTSKVTDMSGTFREARSFNNGELGYVDLSYNLSGTIYTNSTRILFCPNGSFLTDLSSGNILNIKTSSSIIYVSSIENILTDNSLTLLTPYGNNDISTNIISIVKQLPGTSPLTWNTSSVTNMSNMFEKANSFNQNISEWNISNVTATVSMFEEAFVFNQPIGSWDTGNITNMQAMFATLYIFNQPIGSWNTSNVTNMRDVFYTSRSFNQPINSWDTSYVTNMRGMFGSNYPSVSTFNQDIGKWITNNVTDMSVMFLNASVFNQNIGNWNVSNVTTMANMFQSATQFNNGGSNTIQTWYAPKCREFNSMFQSASRFNQPLSILVDTSGVSSCSLAAMFQNDTSFNQNIGNWNVSNVVTMANMFNSAFMFNNGGSDSIKNWYAPKCTSFEAMFRATNTTTLAHRFNQPLSILVDTSGVSSCSLAAMFQNDTSFNQNIGGWNVINVTNMGTMFQSATQFNNGGSNTIQTWYAPKCRAFNSMFQSASRFNQPLSILVDTSGVIDCSLNSMFQNASVFNQPLNFNTINVTTMASMFQSASAFNQPLNFNTINVTTMASMFQSASAFNQSLNTNGNIWNVSKVKTMEDMFSHSSSNTSFKGTLNNWDTSSVTTMEDMFYFSDGFNQNISHFNLSNVTNLSRMMSGGTNKAFNNGDGSGGSSMPLTIWTAPLCTNFTQMFANCSNFNQDISNLVNTSTTLNVSMQGMLQQCSKFNKNVGNWDVSNVIRMDGLFRSCSQFNNDGSDSIKNWKTGKVTNMTAMFSSASVFNQPIGLWDVGNVTLMYDTGLGSGMLQQATEFNQNLNNWNVSKVTTFRNMFRGSTSAPTKFNNGQTSGIVGTNPLLWDTSACTNMQSMFQYCTAFNQNITTNGNIWNVSKVTTVANMFEGISSTNKNKFNNGEAPGGITSPMGWTRTPTPTVTTFRTNSELTSTNMPQGWGIV
jgi:surface protein